MARVIPARIGAIGSVLALGIALAAPVYAQSLPTLNAPVNDFAHVIDAGSANALDQRIRVLHDATKDTVVVATVDSIAGYGSIEEYTSKLYQAAGIGKKGEDNGVLIVVSVQDHKVRVEVGYGLEEFIPDGFAGDTIREEMLPAFRRGEYGPGILAGTNQIIQRIADKRGVALAGLQPVQRDDRRRSGSGFPPQLIFILIFIIFSIIRACFRGASSGVVGGRRGPWIGGLGGFGGGGFGGGGFGGGGGGGGGGGFGGFGGGMSGGGGASGSW